MKRAILIGSLALWSAMAFALPTADEVQAAVNAGNYARADSMMHEVVTARPQSAKAHYAYAKILAHEGRFTDAIAQARAAREADPAIGFADPATFRGFEQELQRAAGQGAAGTSPQVIDETLPARVPAQHAQAASSGVPGWVWVGGFALVAFLLLRAVMRRAANAVGGAGGYVRQGSYPMSNNGYTPGYGYSNGPTAGGSALRTGLAAAGGLAAGMLAEKYLEGRREDDYNRGNYGNDTPQNWDNGQASAASDLENRPVDIGGGDWGGGSSDGGGFDPGGGGGSDGGW